MSAGRCGRGCLCKGVILEAMDEGYGRVSSEAERVRKRLLGTRCVTLAANEGWWQVACVCRVANGQAGTRFVSGDLSAVICQR